MSNLEDFKETEYKYDATNIELKDFNELLTKMSIEEQKKTDLLEVSSWDIYYTKQKTFKEERDLFMRFRRGLSPELTIKKKLNDKNNFDRVEVNLKLENDDIKSVDATAELLGFKENFRIHKACWIYYFEHVDIVYYIVHDENMKEKYRFLEIEFLEHVEGFSTEEKLNILNSYEKKLDSLGINAYKRMKRSLFEIFRKETNGSEKKKNGTKKKG